MIIIGSKGGVNSRSQSLVDAYYGRLYQLAYRLCSNVETSKDLAFQTLEKALMAKEGNFSDEKAYFAWLCRILTNLHRDVLRRKAANALDFVETLPEQPDERPTPVARLELSERNDLVRKVVRALPLALREVVVMYYFEDYPIKTLAAILGVPEGTVKYRLFEARKLLFRELGPTIFEESSLKPLGESEI